MYRHLFRNPSLLSRLIIKDIQDRRVQDIAFRNAALAKLYDSPQDFYSQWLSLHAMDTHELWELARLSFLPQIFNLLDPLHHFTRKQSPIVYPQLEKISKFTALMDPNMFPIQELMETLHQESPVSIWNQQESNSIINYIPLLKKKVGFYLEVKQSNIDHIEAGNGVFLQMQEGQTSVEAGTLLGFYPGVVYQNYLEFDRTHPTDMHLFTFDGCVINFSQKLFYPLQPGWDMGDYENKIEQLEELAKISKRAYRRKEEAGFEKVLAEQINPYAVGQYINHTPAHASTNVCLVDLFVPPHFFPDHFMRFWPFINFSNEKDRFDIYNYRYGLIEQYQKNKFDRGIGVVAIKEIKDGEELYLDYIENDLYDLEQEHPDWLVQAAPYPPEITKGQARSVVQGWQKEFERFIFSKTEEGRRHERFRAELERRRLLGD